ncbi:hypothetical protein [Aurantiacibacter zhengii]|uniref:Uncharacterized protein n=1 Tax=Aurantiacibacter zhengii TaxID=2307003 RepID=A0A418NVX8_9SPHN|nr:hypothetical protein [Aurantiacibacter zhengii]RIV88758.1 hypothetical protein D2V07_00305 [Aurantiacibacter zhengii]
MIRTLTLTIATMAGVFALPAHAQDSAENNNGMQVGTRFERAPENATAAEARWMQKRVANCVFNRNRDAVREILANSNFYSIHFEQFGQDPETLFDDLEVNYCIGRLMRGADNRTYHTYMQIQYSTLRNLLAEEAYLQDFDGPPQVGASPQDVAARFDGMRVHPQVSTMAGLADCLTYNAPEEAHAMLKARPGSGTEAETVDALGPVLAACANSDDETLTIQTSLIRQIVADGLWSRSHYSAAQVEES